MTLGCQFRPKRKRYAEKVIGARQHELFRSLALSLANIPATGTCTLVGSGRPRFHRHNQSSHRPTSMAILISSLVHGILFAGPDGLFGLASVLHCVTDC